MLPLVLTPSPLSSAAKFHDMQPPLASIKLAQHKTRPIGMPEVAWFDCAKSELQRAESGDINGTTPIADDVARAWRRAYYGAVVGAGAAGAAGAAGGAGATAGAGATTTAVTAIDRRAVSSRAEVSSLNYVTWNGNAGGRNEVLLASGWRGALTMWGDYGEGVDVARQQQHAGTPAAKKKRRLGPPACAPRAEIRRSTSAFTGAFPNNR